MKEGIIMQAMPSVRMGGDENGMEDEVSVGAMSPTCF